MVTSTNIMQELKERGYRTTLVRKALLDILMQNNDPLSFAALRGFLVKAEVRANKTTIYRELLMLEKEGVVRHVKLHDAVRRYELVSPTHHHHIVCLVCQKVRDVPMDKKLRAQEDRLVEEHSKGFKIVGHSLEWYGVCSVCSKLKTRA